MKEGVGHGDWRWVAQRVMRWPRLGVCSPKEAQIIVEAINTRLRKAAEEN